SEGFFRLPIAGGQAKGPILDLLAAAEPIIGKAVNDGPCEAGAEGGFDLSAEQFAFAIFTLADGIYAEFTQHEGLGIGQRLQPSEIAFEGGRLMQINVEADEIMVPGLKEFRRRKRGEGAKAFRINFLG